MTRQITALLLGCALFLAACEKEKTPVVEIKDKEAGGSKSSEARMPTPSATPLDVGYGLTPTSSIIGRDYQDFGRAIL